ncbi:amidohydrolase [Microbacterium oleivorans]|uniref:Amidohydrolase family protein n=1 Tax=Microbacterium oleivorans TaxID=273677 RepID=A0A7D5ETW1_9MICO|nr:amidohydrolase family protein [Microbacterium oleivorans]QLD13085.1 amidohydrolase family protein [Microbacterium oleivorans]
MTASDLLLRGARTYGGGEPLDVRLSGGLVGSVAPAGVLDPEGAETIDLDGRFVGPGLWDAHVHFTQWVIQQRRVDLAGTRSASDAVAVVRQALVNGFPTTDGVLFGYGYRDGLWNEPTTQAALDVFAQPVVLINGDLHSAWMNSAGAARLGLHPDPSGVVSEGEWIGVLQRFHTESVLPVADYRTAAEAAAARGVIGIVEYENVLNIDEWAERVAGGVDSLRVDAAVWPDELDTALGRGLRTGDPVEPSGLVTMGRLKVVVDGSLNTRTAYCWDPYPGLDAHAAHSCGVSSIPVSQLRDLLVRARAGGIQAAVHAIGDRANTEVLDTFEELGMPGIIEHAQLVRSDDFARFARLGLIASVQPEHAMDDRDVADRYWAGRTGRAFAFGSLHAAGVALRLGSDAPVAPLDPWHAIASAVVRSRGERDPWHPEQSLPLDVALAASTRHPLAAGAPADIVVTDADPFELGRDALRAMPVAATLLAGRFTHRAL